MTNKTPITKPTIDALPALRYIGVLATGYNIVDVGAARERSITVTNVPAYGTMSVAQVVFAHLLNLTHGMAATDFACTFPFDPDFKKRASVKWMLGKLGLAL